MDCDMFICDKTTSNFNLIKKLFNGGNKENFVNTVDISGQFYQSNVLIEDIDVIIRLIRREWYQFQNIALYDSILPYESLKVSRQTISTGLQQIINCLCSCVNNELKCEYTARTLQEINKFKSSVIPLVDLDDDFIIKLATCANNTKTPVYLYFHTFLDINYFLILLDAFFNTKLKFEECLKIVLKDLICLGKKFHKRLSSAYSCECVKNLWLFTQVLSPDSFWNIFNLLLVDESPLFSLWLLKDVAHLQKFDLTMECSANLRIKPNYSLLENKLKIILLDANSTTMMECFKLIEPLVCQLWIDEAKIEIYQMIWDYYSKRLNVTNINCYTINSAQEFVQLIDLVLAKDCTDDFEYFVGMLVHHLGKYPGHWGKMKGRIYSQLGPNKVKDLTDVGIKHVVILFLCLSTINFDELFKKILSFLDSLPEEKQNTNNYWNIYVSIMIRLVKDGRSLETITMKILPFLNEASNDQKNFRQLKDFINSFAHIIDASPNYNLHQWLLINQWLPKYLSVCYHQDLTTALNTLYKVLQKVESPDSWSQWDSTFKDFMYPSLKQIGNNQSAPGIIGKFAGKISLLIPSLTKEAFGVFNHETIPAKVSSEFLKVILENYPDRYILTQSQETIIIQTWFKISLLTPDENLTRNVIKLDGFPPQLNLSTSDPLIEFIEYLGNSKDMKMTDLCFNPITRWLPQYLNQPDNEATILRIHTIISQTFLHCGPLLYNRNKSSCPLTQLVPLLLLPTDFLMGKHPHPFILNGVKKNWATYFQSLIKLNTQSDGFIERTQKELITKYMPYFNSGDSPMLKCFETEETCLVIVDKLAGAYFKHPTKELDANVLKALKILHGFIESTTSETLLQIVVRKALFGLFEVVIFHPQRSASVGVIKAITTSPLYQRIKEDFGEVVVLVTEKHMAFNSANYFQLMIILAKFIPKDVQQWLGKIKNQLGVVERMRGVGFDKNLRQHMDKLEYSLNNC